jgi:hypothetical protein
MEDVIKEARKDERKLIEKQLLAEYIIKSNKQDNTHKLEVAAMRAEICRLNEVLDKMQEYVTDAEDKFMKAEEKLRQAKLLATAMADASEKVIGKQAEVVKPFLSLKRKAVDLNKKLLEEPIKEK